MRLLTIERERRGWTKAHLARVAELNPSQVGLFESGRLIPYPGQLIKLAAALEFAGEPARLLEEVANGPLSA